uniref:Uncharacterized protein n=1 Tax=Entomoneis paludosa TaxID=265537 RepID=A0A7S3DPF4_9STRA|mmetsp:Transcript_25372/g.52792  ORF Transcript_25372/g.52792 Transcript_25372/m.52792 type:complete len:165 (+) Transcript_25372:43-537(+)
MISAYRRTIGLLLVFLLCSWQSFTCHAQEDPNFEEVAGGVVATVQDKFESLGPKGKAAVGAAVGFVTTRILLRSALTAIKVGAIAVIMAEVMHRTGVLDVEETAETLQNSDLVQKIKASCGNWIGGFRAQVRRRLNPVNLQELFETEKMATLGAAGGAVVACLL